MPAARAAVLQAATPPVEPPLLEVVGNDLALVVGVGVVGLVALAMAFVFRRQVLAAGEGTESMREIALAVQEGASAYLRRQFRTLAVFVVIAFAVLFLLPGDTDVKIGRAIFFVVGAFFSATIGYLGMSLAVRANVRVAAAAREPGGREAGVRLAIRTGGMVGMFTVGLGLLGAAAVVLIYQADAPRVLEGFGFGAALLAMFMRVGGGIFTKAADVGADLVGKVEKGIPEDDPRNAATIADNVGDNVGDCAGMAADLFESYAVTLVAALILGSAAFGVEGLVLPLLVPAVGALTAILGVFLIRAREGESGLSAINRGFLVSAVVAALGSTLAVFLYLPATFDALSAPSADIQTMLTAPDLLISNPRVMVTGAILVGILLAVLVLYLTGHYTDTERAPTRGVARNSRTGAATVVLAGISVGFESAVYTVLVLAAGLLAAFLLANSVVSLALFLVAMAGTGLLTTVGVIVAMDTFGPVSDNAQGIAEMSGDVDEDGAAILTELDAVGNTTKAITKGIAIGTAVLAAVALFGAYTNEATAALAPIVQTLTEQPSSYSVASLGRYEVTTPLVLVGVLIGAAVVFLFSGLAVNAVTRAAGAIVFEVRRQFREHPGIMDRTEKPEYGRVVDICTRDSLRELATPGLLAVLAPVAVGFGLGVTALAGFLAGAIGAGALMAVFLANSGGSWDNAKKIVEDGHYGGKGSEAHAATVIGDTVGDPFKDTAGPAINPLLKVMNLVAILIVPAIVGLSIGEGANTVLRLAIAGLALLVIVVAVVASKLRTSSLDEDDEERGDVTDLDDGDGTGAPALRPGAGDGGVAQPSMVGGSTGAGAGPARAGAVRMGATPSSGASVDSPAPPRDGGGSTRA